MNRLTRTSFFWAVFLALLTDSQGSESCFCPSATVRRLPAVLNIRQPLPVTVTTVRYESAPPVYSLAPLYVSPPINESIAMIGEQPTRTFVSGSFTTTVSEALLAETPIQTTVLKPLSVADEPTAPAPFKPIRPVAELSASETIQQPTVVRKPAIPKSAPLPDPEKIAETMPPPPMPLGAPKLETGIDEQRIVPRTTLRGQSPAFKDALDEAMSAKPPLPQGPIGDPSAIPEKLTEEPKTAVDATIPIEAAKNTPTDSAAELKAKQLTNGVLLIVTVITLGLLVYFIAIALDYRQRWMQTLTHQNDPFTPAFDDTAMGGFSYSHEDERRYGPTGLYQSDFQ